MNVKKKSKTQAVVREIRRKTLRRYSAEEKIRIVLDVTNPSRLTRNTKGLHLCDVSPCSF